MNIFIGGAWPYANGSLHIGHIAALLPGDVLARYYRQKGDQVLYVSGSDCHGTPIQIRAKTEDCSPEEIANHYHREFEDCFNQLGFTYNQYSKTNEDFHHHFVQDFFKQLLENGYIYEKTIEQAFCTKCHQFLPDRFVIGICPNCGSTARGDQCDQCGTLLDVLSLKNKYCSLCHTSPDFKSTDHFFLTLSKLSPFIESYIQKASSDYKSRLSTLNTPDTLNTSESTFADSSRHLEDSQKNPPWRLNAIHLSERYVGEGLRDRAVTRDLDWGISVPMAGFENKKIYVWVEAVLGYLSASKIWSQKYKATGNELCEPQLEASGETLWKSFWENDTSRHYYIHGKDNIPFHTIILPALLKAYGNLHLPDTIISSEYVTLEGRKISTSQNWAVWIPYLLEKYDPDSIRYYFIANSPEKRDIDFSWREFILSHNGELLGAYGNFVNRTLVFIQKSFQSKIPDGTCSPSIEEKLNCLYKKVGSLVEKGHFKDALESIFALIRESNKYFDDDKPWITLKEDIDRCCITLNTCVQIIANLSILLEPFLPFSSAKVREILGIRSIDWKFTEIPTGTKIGDVSVLFNRIDKKRILEEEALLKDPHITS